MIPVGVVCFAMLVLQTNTLPVFHDSQGVNPLVSLHGINLKLIPNPFSMHKRVSVVEVVENPEILETQNAEENCDSVDTADELAQGQMVAGLDNRDMSHVEDVREPPYGWAFPNSAKHYKKYKIVEVEPASRHMATADVLKSMKNDKVDRDILRNVMGKGVSITITENTRKPTKATEKKPKVKIVNVKPNDYEDILNTDELENHESIHMPEAEIPDKNFNDFYIIPNAVEKPSFWSIWRLFGYNDTATTTVSPMPAPYNSGASAPAQYTPSPYMQPSSYTTPYPGPQPAYNTPTPFAATTPYPNTPYPSVQQQTPATSPSVYRPNPTVTSNPIQSSHLLQTKKIQYRVIQKHNPSLKKYIYEVDFINANEPKNQKIIRSVKTYSCDISNPNCQFKPSVNEKDFEPEKKIDKKTIKIIIETTPEPLSSMKPASKTSDKSPMKITDKVTSDSNDEPASKTASEAKTSNQPSSKAVDKSGTKKSSTKTAESEKDGDEEEDDRSNLNPKKILDKMMPKKSEPTESSSTNSEDDDDDEEEKIEIPLKKL